MLADYCIDKLKNSNSRKITQVSLGFCLLTSQL